MSREEVLNVCKKSLPYVDFENADDLIEAGFIDSLSLTVLISELSYSFDVVFDVEDLAPENFSNLDKIVRTIERLRKKHGRR